MPNADWEHLQQHIIQGISYIHTQDKKKQHTAH